MAEKRLNLASFLDIKVQCAPLAVVIYLKTAEYASSPQEEAQRYYGQTDI